MKKLFFSLCVSACFTSAALAEGTRPPKGPELSSDQRKAMADAHEKMAGCLRSDRPMAQCHDEMMKACHGTLGADQCPMMGGMDHMKHGGHMKQPPPQK